MLETVRYYDITLAAEYIRYTKQSVYDYVSRRMIPVLKAGGRSLFRISELDTWLNTGADYNAASAIISSRKNRTPDENINMNVEEIAKYLYLESSTIYNYRHYDKIPYIKMPKNLLFRTVEIDLWLDYGGTYEVAMMIIADRMTA